MAKSLSTILNQIERLQKEAASIQSEVIDRIKKEIAKYSLTSEQVFGQSTVRRAAVVKPQKDAAPKARAAKFADGAGNTWGGMGKRPDWLRQALEAGKALEEFLVGGAGAKTASPTKAAKRPAKAKSKPAPAATAPSKKRAVAKKASGRKPRAKPAASASAA
ncbi:MAG: H-NS histone family protein [Burkholderiales bacterium]|nr:H-NS histone family protein [Burkholderiales bacterium]